MKKKMNRSTRRMRLESLEGRDLFSRDEASFVGVGSLTFSFAPDGTLVGQEISQLESKFDSVATNQAWKDAFARAFQKWAVRSNINFGLVVDNGAPAGIYGPTRGDERFGDIRITGFGFALDSHAEAVAESTRSVGTWSGDMFFNTDANWSNLDAIESAALHEVGHILGLTHSTDPLSPMHQHGPSGALELTDADIANLVALHGPRQPDPNEQNGGNESIGRATDIKGSEDDESVADGFRGDQVWIQFGDLHQPTDRDVYEIQVANTFSGPMAIEVRTSGLSLARLKARVTDRNGVELAQATMQGAAGGSVVLHLASTTPDAKYYVHVEQADDPFWSAGDYSVTIASPQRLQTESQAIAEWARTAHRWYYDSDRIKDGFSYQIDASLHDTPLSDDNHSDDDSVNGSELPLVLSAASRVVHRTVGSISDLVDVDHYVFSAPRQINGNSELKIDLESIDLNGLVPEVDLLNGNGQLLATELRVKGFGQTQLVYSNVESEEEFIVRLRASETDPEHRVGSFSLTATFAEPSTAPELLASGSLNTSSQVVEHEWYIARPQLFGFSLAAESSSATLAGQIWVSVFDSDRRLVTGMVTPWNSMRSAPGIFLDAGTYYFQISTTELSVGQSVAFRFSVVRPSQPIGPVIGPKNVQPLFLCPGTTDTYCYPNSPIPNPNPHQPGPPPSPPLVPPIPSLAIESADGWFWGNTLAPTNLWNRFDVNGDGLVTPLDALIVINRLNNVGFGPVPAPPIFIGHLDANADGQIEPIDVLLVINELNRLA